MFICPKCRGKLVKKKTSLGIFQICPTCDGRSTGVSVLRKILPKEIVNTFWQEARSGDFPERRKCPACERLMSEVPVEGKQKKELLDVCKTCHLVWFDASEYESLPHLNTEISPDAKLPQKAREAIAINKIEMIKERIENEDWQEATPAEGWKTIPMLLGMPIEYSNSPLRRLPWATWLITLLVIVVSVAAFFHAETWFKAYGFIPARHARMGGLTSLTSFFLHAGIMHLVGNMYFFLTFGDNVEDYLGRFRFLSLLVLATIAGDFLHYLGNPASTIPCVGASGGISGIIAYYALKFPRNKLGLLIYYRILKASAWWMFAFWIIFQFIGVWMQQSGMTNVSSLAHIGGAAVGVLFWLLTRKE